MSATKWHKLRSRLLSKRRENTALRAVNSRLRADLQEAQAWIVLLKTDSRAAAPYPPRNVRRK